MKGHKNDGNKCPMGQNVKKYKTMTGKSVKYKIRRMGHNVKW